MVCGGSTDKKEIAFTSHLSLYWTLIARSPTSNREPTLKSVTMSWVACDQQLRGTKRTFSRLRPSNLLHNAQLAPASIHSSLSAEGRVSVCGCVCSTLANLIRLLCVVLCWGSEWSDNSSQESRFLDVHRRAW